MTIINYRFKNKDSTYANRKNITKEYSTKHKQIKIDKGLKNNTNIEME